MERRFGWDCHGLPIEHEIDKKLGIKTKEDLKKVKKRDKYVIKYNNFMMRIKDNIELLNGMPNIFIVFRLVFLNIMKNVVQLL